MNEKQRKAIREAYALIPDKIKETYHTKPEDLKNRNQHTPSYLLRKKDLLEKDKESRNGKI